MDTHPDCNCGKCPNATPPAKDWIVTRLTDHGKGQYYRYRTEGINLNYPPCSRDYQFCWSVPDLDQRYDLSAVTAPGDRLFAV